MIDSIFTWVACHEAAKLDRERSTSFPPRLRYRAKDTLSMQTTPSHHTQALIVGGSLVGLSAALFLGQRGVDTILVEKHRGSSPHPRAIGFTELTLEHYRAAGIEARIPQMPAGLRLRRAKVESLAGTWAKETPWTPGQIEPDKGVASPCTARRSRRTFWSRS
jgi:hypothetical protein